MTEHNIGVDISKAHLDVYNLSTGASGQFDNNPGGFMALAKWLPKEDLRRIVFEPTGPYHRAFSLALGSKFPLVKVNPLQARRFAQACGVRAKTDAVDARSLLALNLDRLVDAYFISETEGIRKPDPEIFKLAARKLSVSRSNCVFVGDAPEADIVGAQQVGMKTVWFPNGAHWPEELMLKPDATIHSLMELTGVLRELDCSP